MPYSSELIAQSDKKGNVIKFVLTTGEAWIFGFVDCTKSSGRECFYTQPLVNLQHKPSIAQTIMKMILCWVSFFNTVRASIY